MQGFGFREGLEHGVLVFNPKALLSRPSNSATAANLLVLSLGFRGPCENRERGLNVRLYVKDHGT